MHTDIKIIKNIRDDAALRSSFNRLAEKTFGLNFENWYQNGYWKDNYIPYAAVREGQVIANVSVNPMTFSEKGILHHYIQLGTVMTDPAFRGQGLCRLLMDAVEKDWADRVESIYLFANDTVLDFYPRFGFQRVQESRFFAPLSACIPDRPAVPVPMTDPENRAALEKAILSGVPQGSFDMVGNPGLILFYASQFLTENVWYLPAHDAWVIAEAEGDTLLLDAIFAPRPLDPQEAAAALLAGPFHDRYSVSPGSLSRLECGFTPFGADGADARFAENRSAWEIRPLENDDDALFVKGSLTKIFSQEKKRFPTLSHA